MLPLRPKSGNEAPALTGRTDRSAGGLNGWRGNEKLEDWLVRLNDVVLSNVGEENGVVEEWLEQRNEKGCNISFSFFEGV